MNKFLDNLRGLDRTKLAALAGIAIAVLALMAAVALSGRASANAMLYSGFSLGDSAKIVEALKAGHIPYRIAEGGHAIMVTPGGRDQARLLLAEKNLPAGNSTGFALFDHQNPLTGSSFLGRINETRAIDGSLERTITLIYGGGRSTGTGGAAASCGVQPDHPAGAGERDAQPRGRGAARSGERECDFEFGGIISAGLAAREYHHCR
jgi:hypothetical protein